MPKSNFTGKLLPLIACLGFAVFSIFAWYTTLIYGGFNPSTFKSTLLSLLIFIIPTISTLLAILFFLKVFASQKLSTYKKAVPVLIQLLLILFLANVGLFVTLIKTPQAAGACVTALDIKNNNYCLLLLSKPGVGYRALNPKGEVNTINSPKSHQGNTCQRLGPTANSVIVYDSTNAFFGATASTYQSIHNAVIDFASLVSKNTSKIPFDADVCSTVSITPGSNNLVTLTDPASTPVPSNTPAPSPSTTPAPSNTPLPPISGDANNDQKVNGVDYAIWLANYGATNVTTGPSKGDFNHDTSVNSVDYSIWLANYRP